MTRLRHAPVTLAALDAELRPAGINLNDEIKNRLKAWAGIANDSVRRLSSRLAIVVVFPVATPEGKITDDLRAFISLDTAGQIGVNWGVLANSKAAGVAGADDVFVRAVPEGAPTAGEIKIEPAQVHLAFDRELAAAVAGHTAPDRRRAVLVGGGALGSQIAMNMAREGAFSWTVVDSDYLLPHNLARHALLTDELGAPKALALARQMGLLLNESFTAVVGDVIKPDAELVQELARSRCHHRRLRVGRGLALPCRFGGYQRTAHLLSFSIRPGQPWCSSPRAVTARSRCGTLRRSTTALCRPIQPSRIT